MHAEPAADRGCAGCIDPDPVPAIGTRIDSIAALTDARRRIPLLLNGPPPPLQFAIPALSAEHNAALQERANRLYDACGCGTGATASLAALALYVVFAVTGGLGALGPIAATAVGAAVFFTAGLLGKVAGIAHARLRLRRMLLHFTDPPLPGSPAR